MRKLVLGVILALGVTLIPMAAAQADPVSDEAAFVAKINGLRASKGLPALQVHANLVTKARAWAAVMAAAGKIWHSTLSDGITADWKKLGENVGMGGSVDGLHAAFVASPGHYANLVDPNFTHVGVGVVMSGKTIFVAEMFMQTMASTAPQVAPTPTTATTAPRPTTTTAPRPTTTTAPRPTTTTTRVAAPRPTTTTTTVPPAPPVAAPAVEAPPAAPEAATAESEPTRAPSVLLVSVLERLRTFGS
jgi:hypothetical protein